MAQISYEDLKGAKEVEFRVKTQMPFFRKHEDGVKKSIILVIPGATADGRTAEYQLWMNNDINDKGKYKGKTKKDVAIEKCYELGMSQPFSPHKVAEIEGRECVFVMEEHSYKNKDGETKKVARVKYMNTSSRPSLPAEEVNALFTELFGDEFGEASGEPESADDAPDDSSESADGLPF